MPARLIIPNGTRFGKLTVVAYHDRVVIGNSHYPQRRDRYKCQCDCGQETVVIGASLRAGLTKSCGCFKREQFRQYATTHGMSRPGTRAPEYSIWAAMKGRCQNSQHPEYPNYGGRGIKVCDAWRDSFEAFYRDMGPRPSPKLSLERLNNDGHYEPGNVKWASTAEQTRNKRTNHLLTLNGRTLCATDWAKELGINPKTLLNRLCKGWTDEEVLTRPVGRWLSDRPKPD